METAERAGRKPAFKGQRPPGPREAAAAWITFLLFIEHLRCAKDGTRLFVHVLMVIRPEALSVGYYHSHFRDEEAGNPRDG